MTCKDCIHYEACKNLYETHGDGLSGDSYVCDYFKDRSRFVELPCKVGDKIYFVFDYRNGETEIKEVIVTYYKIQPDGFKVSTNWGYFTNSDLGVDVFLTREEAEQALKERE